MRVKPGMLFRDGDNTWTGLKDVGFRIGRYGRLEFVHEGEEYAIQYMPVGMQTIESPPEFMIAQMLYAGVDHCILQAGGGYGAMNDYNAFTQSQYPGKFTGLLHIDEAVADRAEVLAEALDHSRRRQPHRRRADRRRLHGGADPAHRRSHHPGQGRPGPPREPRGAGHVPRRGR